MEICSRQVAFVIFWALFATSAFSETDFTRSMAGVMQTITPRENQLITERIGLQQDQARANLSRQQQDLNLAIQNDTNAPETKSAVIGMRQEAINETRRRYAIYETAKRVLQGKDIPTPLAVFAPDVLESIASIANPSLPLCGQQLAYRGDGNQVSWNTTIDKFLKLYGDQLAAVGRLEVDVEAYRPGPSQPEKFIRRVPVGTGFAVAPTKIATAGHVAALFWDFGSQRMRDGVLGVYFNPSGEHKFNCPSADKGPTRLKVSKVSQSEYNPTVLPGENTLDYAVLELAASEKPQAVVLHISKTSPKVSSFVLVVGYPSDDPRVDRETWKVMMQVPVAAGLFPVPDIKRISPGMVLPNCANASDIYVPHNAMTLNRSSGSPIFLAETGEVVAIQIAGFRDIGDGETYCNLGLQSNAPNVSLY